MKEKKNTDLKVGDVITCTDYADRKQWEKLLERLGCKVVYCGKCDIMIVGVPKDGEV